MLIVNDFSDSLVDIFDNLASIEHINNNQKQIIEPKDKNFLGQINRLKEIFSDGHLMPAFGVSLHHLTVEEMKSGDWIKLNFNSEQQKNDLPFTALVFKLDNVYGTNLIREYNGLYDGRCLYFDFNKETDLNVLK